MELTLDLKLFFKGHFHNIYCHNITTPCSFVEAFLTPCRSDIVGFCNDNISSFM